MTRLEILAKAAVTNYDIEDGEIDINKDETIINQNQTIRLFEIKKNLVGQQGDYPLTLPLNLNQAIQQQSQPFLAIRLTVLVYNEETTNE